jgi:hypothetical protein
LRHADGVLRGMQARRKAQAVDQVADVEKAVAFTERV